MLEAQQRGIEANPGYDFYNLNIDAGSMWTRRKVAAMIAAESGTDTGRDDEHSGSAAAALSAVTAAENARVENGNGPRDRAWRPRWPTASRSTATSPRPGSWRAGCRRDGSHEPQAVGPGAGGGRLRGRAARPPGRPRTRTDGRARAAGQPHRHRRLRQRPGRRAVVLGRRVRRVRQRDHSRRAAGPAEPGRLGVHPPAAPRPGGADHPAAAELPAELRPPRLRAGGRRDRHHRAGRDGQGAQGPRRGLPVRLRRPLAQPDGVRRRAGGRARRPHGPADRRRGRPARRRRARRVGARGRGAVRLRARPDARRHQGGVGPDRAAAFRAAVRDVRQQRPLRPRGLPGAHPAARAGDHGVRATCPCSRRWRPAART